MTSVLKKTVVYMAKQGQHQEALELVRDHVKTHPQDMEAWWLLASIVPNPKVKRQCLERVLSIDPSHAKARELIVTLGGIAPTLQNQPVSSPPVPVQNRAEVSEEFPEVNDFFAESEAPLASKSGPVADVPDPDFEDILGDDIAEAEPSPLEDDPFANFDFDDRPAVEAIAPVPPDDNNPFADFNRMDNDTSFAEATTSNMLVDTDNPFAQFSGTPDVLPVQDIIVNESLPEDDNPFADFSFNANLVAGTTTPVTVDDDPFADFDIMDDAPTSSTEEMPHDEDDPFADFSLDDRAPASPDDDDPFVVFTSPTAPPPIAPSEPAMSSNPFAKFSGKPEPVTIPLPDNPDPEEFFDDMLDKEPANPDLDGFFEDLGPIPNSVPKVDIRPFSMKLEKERQLGVSKKPQKSLDDRTAYMIIAGAVVGGLLLIAIAVFFYIRATNNELDLSQKASAESYTIDYPTDWLVALHAEERIVVSDIFLQTDDIDPWFFLSDGESGMFPALAFIDFVLQPIYNSNGQSVKLAIVQPVPQTPQYLIDIMIDQITQLARDDASVKIKSEKDSLEIDGEQGEYTLMDVEFRQEGFFTGEDKIHVALHFIVTQHDNQHYLYTMMVFDEDTSDWSDHAKQIAESIKFQ